MSEKQNETPELSAVFVTAMAKAVSQAVEAAVKPLNDKIIGLEVTVQAAAKAREQDLMASAKAVVQRHVDRGAIGPQDTVAIEFWTEAAAKDATKAESQMARLPGRQFSRLTSGTGPNGTAVAAPHSGIMASAKDLRTKAPDRFKSDADALDAHLHTAAGKADYEAYISAIRTGQGLPQVQVNRN